MQKTVRARTLEFLEVQSAPVKIVDIAKGLGCTRAGVQSAIRVFMDLGVIHRPTPHKYSLGDGESVASTSAMVLDIIKDKRVVSMQTIVKLADSTKAQVTNSIVYHRRSGEPIFTLPKSIDGDTLFAYVEDAYLIKD